MTFSTRLWLGLALLLAALVLTALVGDLGPIVFLLGIATGVIWLMDDKVKTLNDQLDEVIQLLKEMQDVKNP